MKKLLICLLLLASASPAWGTMYTFDGTITYLNMSLGTEPLPQLYIGEKFSGNIWYNYENLPNMGTNYPFGIYDTHHAFKIIFNDFDIKSTGYVPTFVKTGQVELVGMGGSPQGDYPYYIDGFDLGITLFDPAIVGDALPYTISPSKGRIWYYLEGKSGYSSDSQVTVRGSLNISPVPEPATLVFVGIGLLGIGAVVVRRKK